MAPSCTVYAIRERRGCGPLYSMEESLYPVSQHLDSYSANVLGCVLQAQEGESDIVSVSLFWGTKLNRGRIV